MTSPNRKLNGFLKTSNSKHKKKLLGKTCVKCGSNKNPTLDHIVPVIEIIRKYGYNNRTEVHAIRNKYHRQLESMKEEINNIHNYRILCMSCHIEHTKEQNKKLGSVVVVINGKLI